MSFSLKLGIIFYIYDSDRLCGGYQSGLKDNPLSAFSCQESHQSGRKCSLWVIDKDIHFMGQRIFFKSQICLIRPVTVFRSGFPVSGY